MSVFRLRLAGEADIAFIMRTERLEGYEKLVGSWDEPRHRAGIADPDLRYFIAEIDGQAAGFALVKGWNAVDHVALVKRVAVSVPGQGLGRTLVSEVVDRIFSETSAYRVWIGCFPDNVRARKAYEAVGFVAEGIARGNAYFHGQHHDELILSMLRPEWASLRPPDVLSV